MRLHLKAFLCGWALKRVFGTQTPAGSGLLSDELSAVPLRRRRSEGTRLQLLWSCSWSRGGTRRTKGSSYFIGSCRMKYDVLDESFCWSGPGKYIYTWLWGRQWTSTHPLMSRSSNITTSVRLFLISELDTLEVPPLTPTSKEVLSQAMKASFAGFAQERINHHFPHGRASSASVPSERWQEQFPSETACFWTVNFGGTDPLSLWHIQLYLVDVCLFRSQPVVWVGGELLAGLVPGWVRSPLSGLRSEGAAGGAAVWPGQRDVPGPDVWLHCRRDPVGTSGGHEER